MTARPEELAKEHDMYTKIQVVFDAAEPEKLAQFWELALGYVVEIRLKPETGG